MISFVAAPGSCCWPLRVRIATMVPSPHVLILRCWSFSFHSDCSPWLCSLGERLGISMRWKLWSIILSSQASLPSISFACFLGHRSSYYRQLRYWFHLICIYDELHIKGSKPLYVTKFNSSERFVHFKIDSPETFTQFSLKSPVQILKIARWNSFNLEYNVVF